MIARTYCRCFYYGYCSFMFKVLLLLLFILICVTVILVWTKVLLPLLGMDKYSMFSKDSKSTNDSKDSKTSMSSYDDLKILCIKPMHHQEPQGPRNPFEESDKIIDHAKESYLEILKEEKSTVRERGNFLQSNP